MVIAGEYADAGFLLMFDKEYYSCFEVEQKEFMKAFIEKIELYPKKLVDDCVFFIIIV